MKQYLLTPPGSLAEARTWGLPPAHMAFSLDPEGRLRQAALPDTVTGGLMLVGVSEPLEGAVDPAGTVREILALCQARGFLGVILDLETPPSPALARFLSALDTGLARHRRGLFLPEAYANFSQRAFLYLSSALSGGSLRQRLEEAIRAYGTDRLVLSLRRTCEDFFLPAPGGSGRPLTLEELRQRLRRLEPRVHFSQDLCAHYFTYMSRETGAHFVLFDDGDSLARKRGLAWELGLRRFFWLYPEVAEYGPTLVIPPPEDP